MTESGTSLGKIGRSGNIGDVTLCRRDFTVYIMKRISLYKLYCITT